MALCQDQHHPQVPITSISVHIVYCWSCQAWVIYAGRTTTYDDDEQTQESFTEDHLGPFDGVDRVLELAAGYITELLSGSGLPWDRSGW
jgi:hypothetical protein